MLLSLEPLASRLSLNLLVRLLVLSFAHASEAYAATVVAHLPVQITVTSSCVISSASTLNFGSHGVLVGNVDSTSTLRVQCTNATPYNIGLDAGTGAGATVAARKMSNGANTITYALYRDCGRITILGNTVGTNTAAATGNGARQVYTIYGRVPAQTTPAAASYTDHITVTVTY